MQCGPFDVPFQRPTPSALLLFWFWGFLFGLSLVGLVALVGGARLLALFHA